MASDVNAAEVKINASDGVAVAISGDYAVVGAPYGADTVTNSGIYV